MTKILLYRLRNFKIYVIIKTRCAICLIKMFIKSTKEEGGENKVRRL